MKTTSFVKQIEVGEHEVFAYLIGDTQTREAIVVDPADDVDMLIGLAAENGLQIGSIVNTHGHVDHIMGNAEMKTKTGARIFIHEAEAAYLEKIGDFWLEMFSARKSPPADVVVRDGDELTVGALRWQVLHTPGHTPGSICLYQASLGVCLTGDTLFVGSVGRVDGPRSSMEQLLDSINHQLLTLPDDTLIYPGHNYGTTAFSTIAVERDKNPFLNGLWNFRLDE
ncbi:MBL fold metallo-hydrolase [Desulfococcus sp.]|uniref:MBL fold metallo-hydrolase n=1 Tax=Desulfococcus sp. TaxID=2025834 RepID=UPI0035937F7B